MTLIIQTLWVITGAVAIASNKKQHHDGLHHKIRHLCVEIQQMPKRAYHVPATA